MEKKSLGGKEIEEKSQKTEEETKQEEEKHTNTKKKPRKINDKLTTFFENSTVKGDQFSEETTLNQTIDSFEPELNSTFIEERTRRLSPTRPHERGTLTEFFKESQADYDPFPE